MVRTTVPSAHSCQPGIPDYVKSYTTEVQQNQFELVCVQRVLFKNCGNSAIRSNIQNTRYRLKQLSFTFEIRALEPGIVNPSVNRI